MIRFYNHWVDTTADSRFVLECVTSLVFNTFVLIWTFFDIFILCKLTVIEHYITRKHISFFLPKVMIVLDIFDPTFWKFWVYCSSTSFLSVNCGSYVDETRAFCHKNISLISLMSFSYHCIDFVFDLAFKLFWFESRYLIVDETSLIVIFAVFR